MADRPQQHDAIIIGLGPTGATLANLLGACGLEVLVLEREAAAYHLPRAVHFDDEIMRVFQTIGIADELGGAIRVNAGMRFVDPDGAVLLDWPRPQEIGPNGWHASYRFHQPDLERALRDGLERFDGVCIRTRAEMSGLRNKGDAVEVQYRDLDTGTDHIARAKYVVGCDGANSPTRSLTGVELEDLGFRERWLVIDVILKHPKPELGDLSIQYCNPERPATYCRSPGDRRRWEIAVLDHERDEELTAPETIWKMLRPWLTPADAELERSAVYTFQSMIAKDWRVGNIFLAGDAAHLTPPFMGQGMCAGIRDVANLAWKIALSARGNAPPGLLESYAAERRPHARFYIETAMRLGALINASDSAKALAMALPGGDGTARLESPKPPLGEGLGEGLKAGGEKHRNRLFPQPRLSDGQLLDDVCGYAPLLVTALPVPGGGLGGEIKILHAGAEPEIKSCLEALEIKAALIRPDRYILGTADTPDELLALLSCGLKSPLTSHPAAVH